MSKITVVNNAGTPISLTVQERYQSLAEELMEKIGGELESTLTIYGDSERTTINIRIAEPGQKQASLQVSRTLINNGSMLSNQLLEMKKPLQGKGLANLVNQAGLDILDGIGAPSRTIVLHANIDIGGYAWLRKGFWPDKGKFKLDWIIEKAVDEGDIPEALLKKWMSLSDSEARQFVLSKEFSKYKVAFINSDWIGSADVMDPKIRAALTGNTALPAKTMNEAVKDTLIKHEVNLLRYSSSTINRMNNILAQTEEDVATFIRDRVASGAGMGTPSQIKRMEALLARIDAIRQSGWDEANALLLNDLDELLLAEPVWFQGMLTAASPTVIDTVLPPKRMLRAIATSRPFEGKLLKDWARTLPAEDLRRIRSAIQTGMVAGEDGATIARRVIGTRALKGADGVVQISRNQVQAVVRTAVQFITSNARKSFAEENAKLIQKELYVATLDSKTTPICRALDGKGYKLGEGPVPPVHWQCRSVRVPMVDDEFVSTRPAKPVTEQGLLREYARKNKLGTISSRDQLPRGMKGSFDAWARKRTRELVGQVPSTTTYSQWLRTQTIEFQEDVLGKAKAKLFREGGLPLDKFVDVNGKELSLAQLASKYKKEFELAGLTLA